MKDKNHGSTDNPYDNSHGWSLCFFLEELSQLEHDQMAADGGIPSLSKCNAVFVPENKRVMNQRGKKTGHSPPRWYLNQAAIAQEQGGKKIFSF